MVVIRLGQTGVPVPICVAMESKFVAENVPIHPLQTMVTTVQENQSRHEIVLELLALVGFPENLHMPIHSFIHQKSKHLRDVNLFSFAVWYFRR